MVDDTGVDHVVNVYEVNKNLLITNRYEEQEEKRSKFED